MELILRPETEAKLTEMARRTHRGTDELLEEAVEHLVTYSGWFEPCATPPPGLVHFLCFCLLSVG
jgi:ABC-type cobalt transport system substrate-binding protein